MIATSGSADLPDDLLTGIPLQHGLPVRKGRRAQPPELAVAHALCRQLRRQRARREKQRIAHLICLNLLSLLQRR